MNPKPRTITDLRQVIGWIECEIQRKKRGNNKLSLKEGLRLKKPQKQLGFLPHYSLPGGKLWVGGFVVGF